MTHLYIVSERLLISISRPPSKVVDAIEFTRPSDEPPLREAPFRFLDFLVTMALPRESNDMRSYTSLVVLLLLAGSPRHHLCQQMNLLNEYLVTYLGSPIFINISSFKIEINCLSTPGLTFLNFASDFLLLISRPK